MQILSHWSAMHIMFDGEVFEDYFCRELHKSVIFEPHALELIRYLDGKYILCAASNGPYDQQIDRLKAGGIDSYLYHPR